MPGADPVTALSPLIFSPIPRHLNPPRGGQSPATTRGRSKAQNTFVDTWDSFSHEVDEASSPERGVDETISGARVTMDDEAAAGPYIRTSFHRHLTSRYANGIPQVVSAKGQIQGLSTSTGRQ